MIKEVISFFKIVVICFTLGYVLYSLKPLIPEPSPAIPDNIVEKRISECHRQNRKVYVLTSRSDEYVTSVFCKPSKIEVIRNIFRKK